MTSLATVAHDVTSDDVIAVMQRDGGVIVKDFITPAMVEGLKADLLPVLDAKSVGGNAFLGFKTRRMSALFAHSRLMADIVRHPLFLDVAERVVNVPITYGSGEAARSIRPGLRVGATQLIQIAPGQPAQPLHRDDWAFLWRHPTYGRDARVQIMIAISDFTASNGATLVVPGSHTWDDDSQPTEDQAIAAEMSAGSALIWLGSTFHAGGANVTADEFRTGLTVTLDAANVRQEENMYLALPHEVVASYPDDIKALLGWAWGEETNMGWIELDGKLVSPMELVRQ